MAPDLISDHLTSQMASGQTAPLLGQRAPLLGALATEEVRQLVLAPQKPSPVHVGHVEASLQQQLRLRLPPALLGLRAVEGDAAEEVLAVAAVLRSVLPGMAADWGDAAAEEEADRHERLHIKRALPKSQRASQTSFDHRASVPSVS